MRLLVTNSQAPPAYAIVRALRPHAEYVAATVEGDSWQGRLAHAARSRLVDAVRTVPSPVEEWHSGRIGTQVTAREQAFVDRIAAICARDRIDTIFPSWDPYVYVLSKHKARFESLGVTIPVPAFETVLTALDKYRTVRAGEAVGMPCPSTHLHESLEGSEGIAERLGYPIVIKPRFTSGGQGMAIVRDRDELRRLLPAIAARHGAPMIQEYIPGGERDSIQFVIGRDGQLLFVFHKKRRRSFRRTARFGTVSESAAPDERLQKTAALVASVGCWGAMGVETMRDPRDGLDKLMEINPRFPRQVWNRVELGINEPLMCVRVARGEPVTPVTAYPLGVLFVSPVEDVMLFGLHLADRAAYTWRSRIARTTPIDSTTVPPPLGQQLRELIGTYTNDRQRVWDPYSRYFFQDPVASSLWWLQLSLRLARSWRQLGH
jgi:biotin carboxylase